MLKKLYYSIAGNTQQFSFEHRIFNITCFIGTFFTTLGFVLNFSLGLGWMVILTSLTGIAYGSIQYYLSRIRGMFKAIYIDAYVLLTNVLLGITFFYNGGSEGTVFYTLLVNYCTFMLIGKQSQQLRISIVFITTIIVLLFAEVNFPTLILQYENNAQRISDHATLLVYALLFIGLIIRLFRKDYDNEKATIEHQKEEITKLYEKTAEKNQFIESLVAELHHRTKNNLQVVSSLLALQSKRLADENAQIALEESRNRVDAMALIHQKLYLNNELASVNMQAYLEHLSASLASSFGFEVNIIHTHVTLPNKSMDIDRAVPIGLIVNELVTNAFKHAFKQTPQPSLQIQLCEQQQKINLTISDNGSGIPIKNTQDAFGLKLVHILIEQLEATIQINYNNGTHIRIIL
jgi:two-component sensor histidine kinase